jgi:hypothetical protein
MITSTTGEWIEMTKIFIAQSTTSSCYIRTHNRTTGAGEWYIDDISVVEVECQAAHLYDHMAYLPTKGVAIAEDDMTNDDSSDWTQTRCSMAYSGGNYYLDPSDTSLDCYLGSQSVSYGKYYRVKVDVKDGSGSTSTLKLKLYDGAAHLSPVIATTVTWTTHSFVVQATNGTGSASVGFTDATNFSGNIYLRNFSFQEISMLDVGVEAYRVIGGTITNVSGAGLYDGVRAPFNEVSVGDVVHNKTADTWASVSSLNGQSQVTLNWSCFTTADQEYEVYILANSSRYINHFTQDGNGDWGEKGVQLVTGQYDNRLRFTFSKNINDQNSVSYLDYQHLLRQNDGGLVGHWKLSGWDGLRDLTPSEAHGTATGTTLADDHLGVNQGAREFDGTSEFIVCGQTRTGTINSPFSLSAWVNTSSTSSWDTIVGTQTSYWELALLNGNPKFGGNAGGTPLWATGTPTLVVGTWYHIVGTYDGTTARIYVNGIEGTPVVTSNTKASNGVTVIGSYNTAGAEFFHGKIDDVKVFENRVLTEEDSLAMYNGTKHIYTVSSINYARKYGVPVRLNQDFSITDRKLEYKTSGVLDISSGVTISLDFKALEYASTVNYLFIHYNSGHRMYAYFTDNGLLKYGAGGTSGNTTQYVELGRWYKLSATWDVVNATYIFMVDGIVVKTDSLSGLTSLASLFWVGAYDEGNVGNILVENLRIESVSKTEEQMRAYHELQTPFFDPDPNTSPAPVMSLSNTTHVHSISPKEQLYPQGTVGIVTGDATVTGIGTKFEAMFNAGEEIEFYNTSGGTVRYTISSVTGQEALELTAVVTEVTASGLEYKNYTWKDIATFVEPYGELVQNVTY